MYSQAILRMIRILVCMLGVSIFRAAGVTVYLLIELIKSTLHLDIFNAHQRRDAYRARL